MYFRTRLADEGDLVIRRREDGKDSINSWCYVCTCILQAKILETVSLIPVEKMKVSQQDRLYG